MGEKLKIKLKGISIEADLSDAWFVLGESAGKILMPEAST